MKGGFTFPWTIKDFTKISTQNNRECSKPFEVGGYKWRLVMYPNGNHDTADHRRRGSLRCRQRYLSIYLEIHDTHELLDHWSCFAEFEIILRSLNNLLTIVKNVDPGHEFNEKVESSWGFSEFVSIEELKDPANGYLVDDTLTIEACVFVKGTQFVYDPKDRTRDHCMYVESLLGDVATSDVEVRVGDAIFPGAHKTILRQVPFFMTKFASSVGKGGAAAGSAASAPSQEPTRTVVNLPPEEVTPDAFEVVLNFLYKVCTPFSCPTGLKLLEVHTAARFLLMTKLEGMCQEAMTSMLSANLLGPYLRYANLHGLESLTDACAEFASKSQEHLCDLLASDSFLEMATKDRVQYLAFVQRLRDNLFVVSLKGPPPNF